MHAVPDERFKRIHLCPLLACDATLSDTIRRRNVCKHSNPKILQTSPPHTWNNTEAKEKEQHLTSFFRNIFVYAPSPPNWFSPLKCITHCCFYLFCWRDDEWGYDDYGDYDVDDYDSGCCDVLS